MDVNRLLPVGITAGVSLLLALFSWAWTLNARLTVAEQLILDRGPRIERLEREENDLEKLISDPSPKPETRVAIESLKSSYDGIVNRIDRLEERLNALHSYLLLLPRPAPVVPMPFRKGDLDLPKSFQ